MISGVLLPRECVFSKPTRGPLCFCLLFSAWRSCILSGVCGSRFPGQAPLVRSGGLAPVPAVGSGLHTLLCAPGHGAGPSECSPRCPPPLRQCRTPGSCESPSEPRRVRACRVSPEPFRVLKTSLSASWCTGRLPPERPWQLVRGGAHENLLEPAPPARPVLPLSQRNPGHSPSLLRSLGQALASRPRCPRLCSVASASREDRAAGTARHTPTVPSTRTATWLLHPTLCAHGPSPVRSRPFLTEQLLSGPPAHVCRRVSHWLSQGPAFGLWPRVPSLPGAPLVSAVREGSPHTPPCVSRKRAPPGRGARDKALPGTGKTARGVPPAVPTGF